MAQLSDDCFAFGGPMMSVDEAVSIIGSRIDAVTDTEWVDLAEADGRILGADIKAPLALPPFTNSAVDGYAVRGADLPRDTEQAFPIAGRIQAGASASAAIAAGEAVRIFTGGSTRQAKSFCRRVSKLAPMCAWPVRILLQVIRRCLPGGNCGRRTSR